MKLLEDIFFAVYYGIEDLGLDVIWVRCPNLAAMCATDEALEHRQVSASRRRWDLQPRFLRVSKGFYKPKHGLVLIVLCSD
jgi:hypothetical protein